MLQITQTPVAPSVMLVAAHPDDIESWCAGTVVQAIDRGATVRMVLVTSGEHGSDDPRATPLDVGRQREAEARAAAAILGIAEVIFLHEGDGSVENTSALRATVVYWIRRWRPRVLFTHDPEHPVPPYLSHRDHRTVGRATLDAVYPLARDRLAFAEHLAAGLQPHAVEEVWLFATSTPDTVVDISAGFDRKIAARVAHASQTSDAEALRRGWQERAAAFGASSGLALAETFTRLLV